MKGLAITAMFLAVLLTGFVSSNAQAADQQTGCCIAVAVPVFDYMPGVYFFDVDDGPVQVLFKRQVTMQAFQTSNDPVSGTIVSPARATFHRCVCANENGHAGPNDPPEYRTCQYQSNPVSGSSDRDYVESAYCKWKDGIASSVRCESTTAHCPKM
jgi:hypothetical protein